MHTPHFWLCTTKGRIFRGNQQEAILAIKKVLRGINKSALAATHSGGGDAVTSKQGEVRVLRPCHGVMRPRDASM